MPDNKDKIGGRDRDKVAAGQDYEISHLASKMEVSQQQVKDAIEAVGNDRRKVEEYLKSKKNK
jgi:predicted DNA-binding protein YlxM (UPF0122 family)